MNGNTDIVRWHPTQPLIAVGGQPEIRIVDADTGELRTGFQGHGSPVQAMAWSPSGRYFASGASGWNKPNGDTSVRIWSADGKELSKVGVSGYNVQRLAWSRDEEYLAAGADMVKVWTFESDEQNGTAKLIDKAAPHSLNAHRNITGLDWTPDGRLTYADIYDGPLFWSAEVKQPVPAFAAHGQLRSLDWSPDDEQLMTFNNRGILRHWTTDGSFSRSVALNTPHPSTDFFGVSWSPDGERLAIRHGAWATFAVYETDVGEVKNPLVIGLPSPNAVEKLAWSPDSQQLAVSSPFHSISTFLWDRSTKQLRKVVEQQNAASRIAWLGWSNTGKELLRVNHDGRVERIVVATGVVTELFNAKKDIPNSESWYVHDAAMAADRSRAAIRFRHQGKVVCADLSTPGRELWRRDKFNGEFLEWNPRQPLICAGDESLRPTILDAETGKTLGYFGTHRVASAFWSPDGAHLATFPEAHAYQGPINLFHLWKTSPTGAALPEVVGVTLPDGLAASFTPGGAPISLTDAAEKHLTWVIEKPDGRFEYLTRAEFEERAEMASLPSVSDPLSSIPGCVYYWPMNEGRGRFTAALDNQAAQFSGTSSGPEWSTDAAPVAHDNPAALEFDGVDDSLDLGEFRKTTETRLLRPQSTVSLWFKTAERKKMSLGGLYSPSMKNIFFLELNHPDSWQSQKVPILTFGLTDPVPTRRYTRGIPNVMNLCDGMWHHLALAWNNLELGAEGHVIAFVDGVRVELLMANGGTTGWPYDFGPLISSLELGMSKIVEQDGTVRRGAPFKGLLDEFRIYHRVLTEDEIRRLAARRDEAKP